MNSRDITELENLKCNLEETKKQVEKYKQEVEELRKKVKILKETGIVFHSEEVLEAFRKSGARVSGKTV